jgi:protein-S-isoprenylcysteine O-methyltransferase Ste14
MNKYQSYAGYFGALTIVILSFGLVYLEKFAVIDFISVKVIFLTVAITFIVMVTVELLLQKRHSQKNNYRLQYSALSESNFYIFKSTVFRFLALFLPFLLFYSLVQKHSFFSIQTRDFFDFLFYIFICVGFPYIFFTLKFKGDKSYEFGDYAILTIIGVKSFFYLLFNKSYKNRFYQNRRVKKIWLLYLVNLIFISLMTQFITNEIYGFRDEFNLFLSYQNGSVGWYIEYKTFYLIIFHLLFTVDVSIALIGYTFASRWLNNRTKSVDTTLSGWMVALMCYPPLNSVTSQFIPYRGLDTHQLITNEYMLAVILTLLIILYTIYVWATVALGFKFSNLTNRGIVNIGPYKYVRHPAYISKNFAWWVDNTFVLTNIWASIALGLWNVVYIARALTEERHLKKDKEYEIYSSIVKYKFLPKII